MPIHWVRGNLFANEFGAEALGHGCNCKGVMGAGIAVGFKERYPEMYEEYRRRCLASPSEFELGSVFFWRSESQPGVFNLATQLKPGKHAELHAVEQSLCQMGIMAEQLGIRSIAIPKIGCNLGGLQWEIVREIVTRVFGTWQGDLFVYTEYEAK